MPQSPHARKRPPLAGVCDGRAGRIEVIAGCMFSGKTQRLIARLREAQRRGLRVVAFKHRIDDRYDLAHLATHDHDRFDAVRVTDAADLERRATNAHVVGIDEAQFFGAALIDPVRRMTGRGQRIIVAGIDNDAWGNPFQPMPALRELANEFVQTVAPCAKCGAPARYSQRMVPVLSDYMIGGPEAYQARCEKCFEPLPGRPPEVA